MLAHELLAVAIDLVAGDREKVHGSKRENIAALWSTFLGDRLRTPLTAADTALLLALMKIARTRTGSLNPDDFIDGAGYLGCAGEARTSAGG